MLQNQVETSCVFKHFNVSSMSEAKLISIINNGAIALNLQLSAQQLAKYSQYLQLLAKWNQAYNLTAIRDIEVMATKHILDSLAVAAYIHGQRIIDIGSGAGLPGIPLALAFPDYQFVLLDSNGKKTRFLWQAKSELALANVDVIQARVEDYKPKQCFNEIIARAFAGIDDIISQTQHLGCTGARILAMKGAYPQQELAAVKTWQDKITVYPLQVPGLAEERHLLTVQL